MISILNSPATGSSLHDNMWHVAASDNSGAVDFKYVFDVWINGMQKIRVKQFPEPENGAAYFDAGPTVRNYMTYAWFEPINSSAYVDQPNLNGEIGIVYQIRYGEDVSGITTLNMASGETSGYNWAPPLFKRRVTTLATKLNHWFTNRPLYANTKLAENLFIGLYTDINPVTLKCAKYNYANAQIGSTLSSSPVACPLGFIQLNIGTTALSATLSTTFDEAVKYYDVWITDGAERELEVFRVYLTCNAKYTPIPIHFLNRWGLYDTQRFDLASRLEMNVVRKDFGQRDYQFSGANVDYKSSSNRYYEGRINYSNKADWVYKLNADAMTDAEWEWIADLITSPQILMEIDGYFYPVTIKQSSYDYRKFVNDRLKPLEIEFQLNTSRYTQLR